MQISGLNARRFLPIPLFLAGISTIVLAMAADLVGIGGQAGFGDNEIVLALVGLSTLSAGIVAALPVARRHIRTASNSIVISFLAIAIMFAVHASYLNFVSEDAFISFRFAKHLANGNGLTWNIGEPPVEGFTNFLWVIMSAGAAKLGVELPLFVQVLGMLSSLLILIYAYRFARRLLDLEHVYSLIPCILLAVSGPFAAWAISGMETNFFGLMILMGCYHMAYYWRFDSRKDLFLCFAALLLATLTRLEGLIIFSIVLGLSLVLSIGQLKKSIRDFAFPVLLYLFPFLGYFAWRINYFGFLLPNTYYAKTGGGPHQYLRGAIYSGYFLVNFVILPLIIIPLLYSWEKGFPTVELNNRFRTVVAHVRAHVGVYMCALVPIIYTLYIVYIGGDKMAMYRFFVPVLPFIYLIFGLITRDLFILISDSPRKRNIAILLLIFAAAVTMLHSTALDMRLFPQPALINMGHFRGVQSERQTVATNSLIGEFFDQYRRDPNATLATGAIGSLSYQTEMPIYDFHGIVEPQIAHQKVEGSIYLRTYAGHEKKDLRYVLSKMPTYLMLGDSLTEEPSPYPPELLKPEIAPLVEDQYQWSTVYLSDEGGGIEGYFSFLELEDDTE